jgi:hypothetical protein
MTASGGSVGSASSDANVSHYPNGDWKRTVAIADGELTEYFYAHVQTLHTTFPDGVQTFKFPNGQLERHSASGHKSIVHPGGGAHSAEGAARPGAS